MNNHSNCKATISILEQYTNEIVRVFHRELGEFDAKINNIVETGNVNTDYLELEYYTDDNTLTSQIFSPLDLLFPGFYLPSEYYYRYGFYGGDRYNRYPFHYREPYPYRDFRRPRRGYY